MKKMPVKRTATPSPSRWLISLGLTAGVVVIAGCILLFGVNAGLFGKKIPDSSPRVATSIYGKYQDYNFVMIYRDNTSRRTVTFNPELPNEEALLVGAMEEVLRVAHRIDEAGTPRVDSSAWRFTAGNKTYAFMPIRSEEGTVHHFTLWLE